MSHSNKNLDRLLRAAAQVDEEIASFPPFGFETRVISQSRSRANSTGGLGPLLQRVALVSAAVMVISSVAAVRELQQTREVGDAVTNEFAIADSAIEQEFLQ